MSGHVAVQPGLSRRDLLFLILAAIFVTNAVLAELIGGKLIQVCGLVMSIGVIPWPVVFVTTDLINEYYGRTAVRRLTWMTLAMIAFAFAILFAAMAVPAWEKSPVSDAQFTAVFGQSLWIIAGSMIAFAVSQLVDVTVFWFWRERTGGRFLWLRATGSTLVSQAVDTVVILSIAFYLPGKIAASDLLRLIVANYTYKVALAAALTPILYGLHNLLDRWLGQAEAEALIAQAAAGSLSRPGSTAAPRPAR